MRKEYVKSKRGKIFFIIIVFLLFLLVGNSFIRDIIFQFTKNETQGQIISIEKNEGFEPYKIKVKYFDTNKHSYIEYYKLISNSSKNKIENLNNITILYPKLIDNVYIKEDEYPMFIDFILQLVTMSALVIVFFKLIKELRNKDRSTV
jgi:hypothetical protein